MSYKKFGIDISKWQGSFDLAAAKKSDSIEFVIIKAGGGDDGLYKDSKFATNYKNAVSAGLYKGAYFFGNATTTDAAVEEAEYFASLLDGKKFELPVYYDVESSDMLALTKAKLTKVVKSFCDKMEDLGYYVGIYMSKSYFSSQVNDSQLSDYAHWVAQWATECSYSGDYGMWQFGGETNKIRSNEINGTVVDMDYMLIDYPSVILEKGFNGYEAGSTFESVDEETETTTTTKTSSTSTTNYAAGTKLTLKKVSLYASSTSSKVANTISGTYYIWDSTVKNKRIRITNAKSKVGVSGEVTGWIKTSAIS